jgi:hypothetical protein
MRYRPAVTRVEECTREEIGVGAAIAAGSHGENGNNALLVIKATTIMKGKCKSLECIFLNKKVLWGCK